MGILHFMSSRHEYHTGEDVFPDVPQCRLIADSDVRVGHLAPSSMMSNFLGCFAIQLLYAEEAGKATESDFPLSALCRTQSLAGEIRKFTTNYQGRRAPAATLKANTAAPSESGELRI